MSSAETTAIRWGTDGLSGETAYEGKKYRGFISRGKVGWNGGALIKGSGSDAKFAISGVLSAASAARSFVEKSVKEAGHGE